MRIVTFPTVLRALFLGVILLPAIFAATATRVAAQESIPPAIAAVVDVTNVLDTSETWKNAKAEMQSRVEALQKDIDTKRDELQAKAEQLQQQKTILAPDVYQQRANEIQQQQRILQRDAQVSNAKINELLANIRARLRGVIVQLSAKVASEKGMNIGFDRSAVLFFNDGIDISKEVLKRFNESDTKVEFTEGKAD